MSFQRKKLSFPSSFTILFIVLILAAVLTFIVPAGSYTKLSYDPVNSCFLLTAPDGSVSSRPATDETLESLGISSKASAFADGSITSSISVPDTYEQLPQRGQGLIALLEAPVNGVYATISIMLFILILGGSIGVLNATGAFNAGIAALSRATKGREFLLIIFITVLIALGGTTFGLAEETVALYPILLPVFMMAGYDPLVCVAAIFMGSSIGVTFSTSNPFAAVIASNAAGISFTDGLGFRIAGLVLGLCLVLAYVLRYARRVRKTPSLSLVCDQGQAIGQKYASPSEPPQLTGRIKLMLIIFLGGFIVMTWGVASQGWSFLEMTTLFLAVGLLIGVCSGLSEKEFIHHFIAGASDLVSVGLVVGIARGVNLILQEGLISDTILYALSGSIRGMSPYLFIVLMLFIFAFLGFFINSSSGLAMLAIPIMAPLATAVGAPAHAVISAYLYGLGLVTFITPTGMVLVSLEMVDITYDRYLKFALPLMLLLTVFSIIMLLLEVGFAA